MLTLHGTPGATYTIQRTGNLASPNWSSVGSVTIDGLGNGSYTEGFVTFPAFYRALTQ